MGEKLEKEEKIDNKQESNLEKELEKVKAEYAAAEQKKENVRKTLQNYYTDATAKLQEFKTVESQVQSTQTAGYSNNQIIVYSLIASNVLSALALGKYYSENQSLQNFKTGF